MWNSPVIDYHAGMPPSPHPVQQTWDQLTQHLDAFLAAWSTAEAPPELANFLPTGPPALRRLTLVELIKVDLENRWRTGADPLTVEEYAIKFPELNQELPADLVYEEYLVRRTQGETVQAADYIRRFPALDGPLRRLMGLNSAETTTSLAIKARPDDIKAGDTLDDFDLLTLLGKGAFASVFLARQRSMQRLVALKISADRGNEPQTLAQLDHPYIVRVYDQRQLPQRKLRLLYMQYVAGGTLHDVIERMRKLPPSERSGQQYLAAVNAVLDRQGESAPADSLSRRRLNAATWTETVCRLGAQLAGALDYAHGRGVLHRDLKPANVLVAADGSPKLADFNISFSSNVQGATPAAYFGGSLAYMSPEQLEASNPNHPREPEELDGRSDIYSVGVLLWELLFGDRPFHDEELSTGWAATLSRMTELRQVGSPPIPEAARADPQWLALARVLSRCLEPERERRHATAGDLARQLLLCLQPRTGELLRGAGEGWRNWVRRRPIMSIGMATVFPNALAGWFAYAYNKTAIVDKLTSPGAADTFFRVQGVINAIAFPLGAAIAVVVAWPIATALRPLLLDRKPSAAALVEARRSALGISQLAAVVGITLWSAAGIAYPVMLHWILGGLPAHAYPHFMGSHILCGLIAAAYPFFLIARIVLRSLYPALLVASDTASEDEPKLLRLAQQSGLFLLLAGVVPMLGMVMIVILGIEFRMALTVLSAAGGAGLALAFWLYRLIQRDISALLVAVRPYEAMGSVSDSVESF